MAYEIGQILSGPGVKDSQLEAFDECSLGKDDKTCQLCPGKLRFSDLHSWCGYGWDGAELYKFMPELGVCE